MPPRKPTAPSSFPKFTRPPRQDDGTRNGNNTRMPRVGDRQEVLEPTPRREQRYSQSTQTDGVYSDAGTSRRRQEGFRDRVSRFSERGNSRSGFRDSAGNAVNERPTTEQGPKQKPQKPPRLFKKPAMEVYIPSTVPVGALSKILKVRLGASNDTNSKYQRSYTEVPDRLQRRIVALGLTDSPTYDYRQHLFLLALDSDI